MSHFSRIQKATTPQVVNSPTFMSGDDGKSADAGASKQVSAPVSMSVPGHMQDVAYRHDNRSDTHDRIASGLRDVGMTKQADVHTAISNQHQLAAGHYRAAAHAVGAAGGDVKAAAPHLKQARACADSASGMTVGAM